MQAPAKAVLFVLLACGLAFVAFTLLRYGPSAVPSAALETTEPGGAAPAAGSLSATEHAAESGTEAPAMESGSAARRSEVESEPAKAAEARLVHVRGRLVSGSRGMPGVKLSYTESELFEDLALPLAERNGKEVESGADGVFSIPASAGRTGLIRLAGEEFVFADRADNMVAVRVGETDVDLGDLTLAAAARLAGVVRDRDGAAVAGIEVALALGKGASSMSFFARQRTTTDEQGKFRFGGLRGSEYTLTTASPHHLPASIVADVAAGAVRDDIVIELESGASIAGRVVDDVGQPVAGMSVGAYRTTQPDPSIKMTGLSSGESVKTNAAGEFRLGGIEEEVVTLRAWGKGYRAASQPEVRTGTDNVTITLQRLGSVQGRLVDAAGQGVAGSRVGYSSGGMEGIELRGEDVITAADGSFVLEDVPPGEVALHANGKHLPVTHRVVVHPGAPTTGVRMVAATGASIAAVVVDADGEPVADAVVQVEEVGESAGDMHGMAFRSRRVERRIGAGVGHENVFVDDGSPRVLGEARTGKDGVARIDGLPAGAVTVIARHDEHAPSTPASLTLADSGTEEARLTLRQGGALDLRVIDDEGLALADATVLVRGPEDMGETPESHRVKTDGEGKAHLGSLPAGSYSALLTVPPRPINFGTGAMVITAGDPGTIEASRVGFTVRAGDTASLQLVQPTLTTLTGTLRDASGAIAQGKIEVAARDTPEALMGMGGGYSATTDRDGRYTIEGLPPGSYDLRYGRKDQVIAGKMTLDLHGEKRVERDLLLDGGVVEVTVLGSDGEPLRGADVVLRAREQEAQPQQHRAVFAMINVNAGDGQQSMQLGTQQPMVHTDEEGVARIADVPPGKYTLSIEHPRHVTHRVPEIDVSAGSVRALGTVSLAKGGVIRGRVLDASGAAPMIAQVELRKAGGEPRHTMAMQGSFQFTGLEPGRYQLRAHQIGPNSGEYGPIQEIELGAGGNEKVDLALPR